MYTFDFGDKQIDVSGTGRFWRDRDGDDFGGIIPLNTVIPQVGGEKMLLFVPSGSPPVNSVFNAHIDDINHGLGPGATVQDVINWIFASSATPTMPIPASSVTYDNTASGLPGTNVQAALDELAARTAPGTPVRYQGIINCAGNPNYPAASRGDFYIVGTAGRIGGASGKQVASDDYVFCNTDSFAGDEAAVGFHWDVAVSTRQQATPTLPGIGPTAVAADVNAGTSATKFITPEALAQAGFRQHVEVTIGDGAASSFTVAHGFNTRAIRAHLVRQISPWDEMRIFDLTFPTADTAFLDFGAAVPSDGEYRLWLMPFANV